MIEKQIGRKRFQEQSLSGSRVSVSSELSKKAAFK